MDEERPGRTEAIEAALAASAAGAEARGAVVAAAQALSEDPWAVVVHAGALARAQWVRADADGALDARLRWVAPDSRRAVARFTAGMWVPRADVAGRRRRGAFDTGPGRARRVVRHTLAACRRPVRVGMDPSAGAGAFLVALAEAGVPEVWGMDLDPLALAVAAIAVPEARLVVGDAFDDDRPVDVMVGNPPFLSPERQHKGMRRALKQRMPWLSGRFDLSVPFVAACTDRVRAGGAAGWVWPASLSVERYAEPLRRRWLKAHRLISLSAPEVFPRTSVRVQELVVAVGEGPAPVGPQGPHATQLLATARAPLDVLLGPDDPALAQRITAASVPLGSLARVDTGVVAHGPLGGKARLLRDAEEPGAVPYADAREVFAGTHRWLLYRPDEMHRAKDRALFESPKLILQRIRGRGPVVVRVDRSGLYVGHTCTVVVPHDHAPPLERLAALLRSPAVAGWLRIDRGPRLDLYPRDVGDLPVPRVWLEDPSVPAEVAWGLSEREVDRLQALADPS